MKNKYTGQDEEPDERLMRSIEEKIDIPESRKDDFRREIMNYIGALAIEGRQFDYRTNERLHKALELKLFEDQKDSIKLTSLVSAVVDRDTQEKIDIVKNRMIRNYGYCEICSTDVLNFVAQHLRARRREGLSKRMDDARGTGPVTRGGSTAPAAQLLVKLMGDSEDRSADGGPDARARAARSGDWRPSGDGKRLGVYDPDESSASWTWWSDGPAAIDQDHRRFREIVRGKISRTCASTSRRAS